MDIKEAAKAALNEALKATEISEAVGYVSQEIRLNLNGLPIEVDAEARVTVNGSWYAIKLTLVLGRDGWAQHARGTRSLMGIFEFLRPGEILSPESAVKLFINEKYKFIEKRKPSLAPERNSTDRSCEETSDVSGRRNVVTVYSGRYRGKKRRRVVRQVGVGPRRFTPWWNGTASIGIHEVGHTDEGISGVGNCVVT